MAVRMFDGFDSYGSAVTNLSIAGARGWYAVGPDLGGSSASTPFGSGYSLRNYNASGGTEGLEYRGANHATWIVGFAMNIVATDYANQMCLVMDTDSSTTTTTTTSQVEMKCIYSGTGTLYNISLTKNNGAVLLAGPVTVSMNTWYYYEMKVTISPTSGYAELRINTDTVLTYSGNTQVTANAYANTIGFNLQSGFGGPPSMYLDDVYIADGSGTINNDFMGQARIESVYPNTDGTKQDWAFSSGTSTAALVSDTVADGDTSYIADGTAGHTATVTIAPTIVGRIAAISLTQYARKDDTALRETASVVVVGPTTYTYATHTLSSTYDYYSVVIESDPATSSGFLMSNLITYEFGVKMIT